MKTKKLIKEKRLHQCICILLGGMLAITSCKGTNDKESVNETTSAVQVTTTTNESSGIPESTAMISAAETTESSSSGGEAVLGITQEPAIFDPHKALAAGDREILFNVYEGLLKCTPNGDFVPALSTGFEISDDALTYQFTLRDGVSFHNGDPVTPEDVVYSLKRAAGLIDANILVKNFNNISDVSVDENGHIDVKLKTADVGMAAFFTVAVIPADADDDLQTNPVGTGPFQWVSYTVGQSVVLEKNENYWQSGLPYLDKVTFKITAGEDAAFLELQSGSIDIFPYLSASKAEELKKMGFNIVEGSSNMTHIFALNNNAEYFNDPKIREAVNYAVDKDTIMAQLSSEKSPKLTSAMSPLMGEYYNADLEGTISFDPEKAKELLAEAGYPDGFSTTVTVASSYIIHVNTAVLLAEQLKAVGIDLQIVPVDWNTWLADVHENRDFASTVIALTPEFHPASVMQYYASDYNRNFINYTNLQYDKDYKAALEETDRSTQIELYHNLQTYLAEDFASVFIQDPVNKVAVMEDLEGYYVYPIYVQDLSTVRFK